jgi:hypothetical protein
VSYVGNRGRYVGCAVGERLDDRRQIMQRKSAVEGIPSTERSSGRSSSRRSKKLGETRTIRRLPTSREQIQFGLNLLGSPEHAISEALREILKADNDPSTECSSSLVRTELIQISSGDETGSVAHYQSIYDA